MDIRKVGVVGCGTMGSGICEVVARAGLPVGFVERTPEGVERGLARIAGSLQRAVDGGKLDAGEKAAILARISGDTAYDVLADADLVFEAVPEDLRVKQQVFREVDAVLQPHAAITTNTSSLSVMQLAVVTNRPHRVLGFHFFNPAPVMPLIELITTVVSEPDTLDGARAFTARIGKTPVVARDRAGFVANVLLFPYLNQAVRMLEGGYATREDIDAAMQLGAGHPMGPLALMDLIGLDSAHSIMERLYEQFQQARYAPRPLIKQLVSAGFKGRKSGRGFYTYAEPDSPTIQAGPLLAQPPADPAAIADWTAVGVLGTGTMAAGIAEVCAKAGFDVVVRGRSVQKAENTLEAVGKSLARAVSKGKLDEAAREQALQRLTPSDDLAELAECDLIIEAVAEHLDLKRALFGELDEQAKPDALLATTTSSLPVIDCAMATGRPERVVGIHFFNPVAVMRLVEVVATVRSADDAVVQARAFAGRVGKHPVMCGDRAGFIVNALLFPYLNDAVKMLEEGYATVAAIDSAMKLGCGHPMGPFELMDVVGLDVSLEVMRALHAEFREPGVDPARLLGDMVGTGFLGRKSGRGFHVYQRA